jgi:tRNA pseudouridine38-40 synthase
MFSKEESATSFWLSTRSRIGWWLPPVGASSTLPRMPGAYTYSILHYLGQDYAGWQMQSSCRTVQGEFEGALQRLMGKRIVTHAAGRTDAGVHALGQLVSFVVPDRWNNPPELLRALRALTPPDLWVKCVGRAPEGFHARKHAASRRYRYVVGCDEAAFSPFRRPFEWALGKELEQSALIEAASQLIGEHDFRAFSITGQEKRHYLCRVALAEWRRRDEGQGFIFEVEADRFLHRMVRFLVGTMVDVGRGRRPSDDVSRMLSQFSNAEASPPAPPEGLYFVGARYPQLDEVIDL